MNNKSVDEAKEITEGGERASQIYPNDCYFAHLSIYRFALPFVQNKKVLDAGCGSGYGANYLAMNGAESVRAIDISPHAIEFCKNKYKSSNLEFDVSDLGDIKGFDNKAFDVIFTSNTLEHVVKVGSFFDKARRILKEDGLLLLAIPPIINEAVVLEDINNPYHINFWSPKQWNHVLHQFFDEVQGYQHICNNSEITLDFMNTPAETKVDETMFEFNPIAVDEYYSKPSLTAVFIARCPKRASEFPFLEESISFIDDSFTRPILESCNSNSEDGETTEERFRELENVLINKQNELDEIYKSKSWRLAMCLRSFRVKCFPKGSFRYKVLKIFWK